MQRFDIINRLIKHHGYKSFLEIGIAAGNTWRRVECEKKMGVEPELQFEDENIVESTSDKFFEHVCAEWKFDIIFIDGLHIADQVYRDIQNAWKHLARGGTIVLHDCNPPTWEHAQEVPKIFKGDDKHFVWCGTVWHALMTLKRKAVTDLRVVDSDWGVGIIQSIEWRDFETYRTTPPNKLLIDEWFTFDQYRETYLHTMTVNEFKERYPVA